MDSITVCEILKSCEVTDILSVKQKEVVQNVLNKQYLLQTSSEKGCYGEIVADLLVKNAGCKKMLQITCDSLRSPGHQGLDGLYIYKNVLLITEVKYGKSRLIKTLSGRQMSDTWVDPRLSKKPYVKKSRLDKAVGGSANGLIEALQKGELILLKLLIRISYKNFVSIHLVDSNGKISCRNITL